jgi:hypothetical protein
MAWGEKGEGTAQKPGDASRLLQQRHGIAVDPVAHEVFVNDRNNRRSRYSTRTASSCGCGASATPPSDVHLIIMDGSRNIWAADRGRRRW